MFSSNEEQLVIGLRSIHDQQLIRIFNNPSKVEEPQVGLVISKGQLNLVLWL
jgi:hypothetical protein